MSVRFPDSIRTNNVHEKSAQSADFVMRKNIPALQIFAILVVSVAAVLFILNLIVPSITAFSAIIFIICVGLGTYGVIHLQNSRDMALYAEFLNALFSSALARSNKFCVILKNDGTIVYFNSELQEIFPKFMKEQRRSIDIFLEHAQVSKEQKRNVFYAIEKHTKERVIIDVIDGHGQNHRLIMSLEPLSKPSGYTLFYGHEFVEDRSSGNLISNNASLPTLFNRANLNFLSYITGNMNIGAYAVDSEGKIIYVNQVLEEWLQYNDREIVAHGFSVRDLVDGGDGEAVLENFNSFDGEVSFNRKISGFIRLKLNHKVLHDDKGKIIGFLALAYLSGEAKKINPLNNADSW